MTVEKEKNDFFFAIFFARLLRSSTECMINFESHSVRNDMARQEIERIRLKVYSTNSGTNLAENLPYLMVLEKGVLEAFKIIVCG